MNPFIRTELLIGKEALQKLNYSKIAILGLGGVGSYVAEGLARSGVGSFVLIDGDDVCLSNINRQIIATYNTLNKSKVEATKERIFEINPEATIYTHKMFYSIENNNKLLCNNYDYIVDAIDMVSAKIELVVNSKELGLPIISSMGMGNKLDPTKIGVSDIYKTSVCPLSRVVRKELRKRQVASLKVVYSSEEPIKGFTSNDDSSKNRTNVNKQAQGTVSFVPSVAGLIIAGEIVKDIINN